MESGVIWVSVDEGVPANADMCVLLHVPSADDPFTVWLGWFDESEGWFYMDGMKAQGVKHWAPLPIAPGATL